MSIHAMIDIETLSIENNAVIASIGVVLFDPFNESPRFNKSQYHELSWSSQILEKRHIDPETIDWWNKQPLDIPIGKDDPEDVIDMLNDFVEDAEFIWFRGPQFDEVKLQSLAKDFDRSLNWKYSKVRDCRTLDIFGKRELTEETKAHHALHDAIAQARDVCFIYHNFLTKGSFTHEPRDSWQDYLFKKLTKNFGECKEDHQKLICVINDISKDIPALLLTNFTEEEFAEWMLNELTNELSKTRRSLPIDVQNYLIQIFKDTKTYHSSLGGLSCPSL
ncbi:MAG: 3'-5' exoribonuclease [Lentisphaeraceae bacterium]|nr:3'-5' exoribonuclease [Lentisphaeraceae bacterium]